MNIVAKTKRFLDSDEFTHVLMLVGRVLLAFPFPLFGVRKIFNQPNMMALIETAGIPGWILYFIIPYQILFGLGVWLGFQTRWSAFFLGAFCFVAPWLYHIQWDQPHEMAMFFKDMAQVGGYLFLWKFGPGKYSVDAWLKSKYGGS